MSSHDIAAARKELAAAGSCVVLTGAGMSAESGVPTFRDALTGLWSRFDPERLASREGFAADPRLVWRWYAQRRQGVLQAQPNAGHLALVDMAARFDRFAIVTQNVDGLHARAGSRDVLELHGNILRTKCFGECGVRIDDPRALPPGEPPACPRCSQWLRPDVVWFGELLDPGVLARAERLAASCDVMLVVGTSGVVYPAAGLPSRARAAGARLIVVNPNPSELDDLADVLLRETAARALPALAAAS
ncbi:MAG TPA: NAD-dependent deacylase [Burkholderiaceae bacterium]|jgi:NAD-dependent deacetylase|nr:NAD-dependent deacylase [Burkholderiaceae bacterium]